MQYEGSVVQWECTKGIDVCNLVLTLLDSSMNDKMIKFYITKYMLTSNSLCELSKTSWWSINYQSSTPFWVIRVINYLIKGLYILVLIIYCMYMLIKGIVRLTFIVFGSGILLQCYIWTFAVYFKTYCEFQRNTKCMHALLIPQTWKYRRKTVHVHISWNCFCIEPDL